MTDKKVVTAQEFFRKKEQRNKSILIDSLELKGNLFRGTVIVEQDVDFYVVKLVFNLNNNVIIIKEEFSIYDGIDLEQIVARAAEEIAIHVVLDTVRDTFKTEPKVKHWLKKKKINIEESS